MATSSSIQRGLQSPFSSSWPDAARLDLDRQNVLLSLVEGARTAVWSEDSSKTAAIPGGSDMPEGFVGTTDFDEGWVKADSLTNPDAGCEAGPNQGVAQKSSTIACTEEEEDWESVDVSQVTSDLTRKQAAEMATVDPLHLSKIWGNEEVFDKSCGHKCGSILPCGHHCQSVCHGLSKCPVRCGIIVDTTCRCGRKKGKQRCTGSEVAAPIDCDQECDNQAELFERNRRIALAMGIDSSKSVWSHSRRPASFELIITAKHEFTFVQRVERAFHAVVSAMPQCARNAPPGTLPPRPVKLWAMGSHHRWIVHSMAQRYGLQSESVDDGPHRLPSVWATESTEMPEELLSQLLMQEPKQWPMTDATLDRFQQPVIALYDISLPQDTSETSQSYVQVLLPYFKTWRDDCRLRYLASGCVVALFESQSKFKDCCDVLAGGYRGIFRTHAYQPSTPSLVQGEAEH